MKTATKHRIEYYNCEIIYIEVAIMEGDKQTQANLPAFRMLHVYITFRQTRGGVS